MGMQLSGSLELTGSLTTSGAIVAQTLVVQTITSSITQMTGSNIFGSSLTNRQQFTGSVTVTGSLAVNTTGTELQVNANGVNLGNALTDSHVVSGSFRVNPNGLFVSGSGFVGVGAVTSSIGSRMVVSGSIESLTDPGGEGGQLTLRGNTFQYAVDNFNGTGVRIIRENDGTGAAGVALMFVSGSGNVGIGTGSPAHRLDISGDRVRIKSGGLYGGFIADNTGGTGGGFYAAYKNGVAVGYFGTSGAILGDTSENLTLYNDIASNIDFWTNNVLRMRITGGDLLIGTTSNVGQRLRVYQPSTAQWNIKLIQPDGSSQLFQEFLTTTDNDATNTARGSIRYNGTNVLYLGTSDYRLKEDLRDYNALNIIGQLKTYDFKWKEAGTRDYGMMAHELQQVLPNYVTGVKDDINEDSSINPQQVDYSKLIPILVKAIQELEARVKELENK